MARCDDRRSGTQLVVLTPGPLATAAAVKLSMMYDYGSRDHLIVTMSQSIRRRPAKAVLGEEGEFVCGSGTFAIEAAIGTLVPRDGGLVVLANDAYGRRIADIAIRIGQNAT
jgi:2-aminoethylphosphonate-pyruvate transaminase